MSDRRLNVVSVCWHCRGTGFRLASVGPLRFCKCPYCNGYKGRCEPRYDPEADGVTE